MADSFELYRLSLLPKAQGSLIDPGPDQISREEWLRQVFDADQPFVHYGSQFHYLPASNDDSSGPLMGKVGRRVLRSENTPPAEGLEDITHVAWLAAVLVLDPSSHADGQKLAIQNVPDVGKPLMLVKSLITAINARYPSAPYTIEAGQIVDERSFWDFVSENRGNVTSMTVEFIAPNMFGGDDEITKELRDFRDREKASRVNISLSNNDGINPDTEKMRTAVTYATRGGGRIRARAKPKKTYRSEHSVKRTHVEGVKETGAEFIVALRKLVGAILGRE